MKEVRFRNFVFFLYLFNLLILLGCVSTIPKFCKNDFNEENNLILNGNFENQKSNGNPEDWLIVGNREIILRMDDNIAQNGKLCLSLSNLGSQTDLISNYFKVNPSEIFYCRGLIKSGKESHTLIKLSIVAFDKNGNVVNTFSDEDYVDKKWKKFEITSGFLSTSARYARIIVSIPTDFRNSIWIDDIECYSAYKFMK